MRIEKLEPSQRKQGRWLVWLEDGTLIRVGEADVAGLGLYAGLELSEEMAERLQEAARLGKLKQRALNILSARALSRRELLRKLAARPLKGEEEAREPERAQEELDERAEQVADWLERLGLLDDGQYAKDVVRWCGEKGYGERRARDELFRRGVPRELWDEALEGFGASEEAIDRFLNQKLKGWDGDPRQLKRAADALARRGFSWSEISEGLERFQMRTEGNDSE